MEQVNIWIEKVPLRLHLLKVEIMEDAIPQGALSDLESDTKAVSSVAILYDCMCPLPRHPPT